MLDKREKTNSSLEKMQKSCTCVSLFQIYSRKRKRLKTNERYEPIKESEDFLNKFEALLNDFKIYRDGKAITLTRDELLNFHRLDGIIGGMIVLDNYK